MKIWIIEGRIIEFQKSPLLLCFNDETETGQASPYRQTLVWFVKKKVLYLYISYQIPLHWFAWTFMVKKSTQVDKVTSYFLHLIKVHKYRIE